MSTPKIPAWSPAELHRHLTNGSPLAVLDLRNRDEFDAWQIEGKGRSEPSTCPITTCST